MYVLRQLRSEADPKFWLRYTDVQVGEPSVDDDAYVSSRITPFQCRLRDCTYSAPITVDVRYTRGRQIVVKRGVMIGRIPIMLRSCKCILTGKTEAELAEKKVRPSPRRSICLLCACLAFLYPRFILYSIARLTANGRPTNPPTIQS